MDISEFDYCLPEHLIAQHRVENRDESRLLVVNTDNTLINTDFYKIHEFIDKDSLIVFNDSRVIKAYLTLYKNNKEIGINLNKPLTDRIWTGFARPQKKLEIGDSFDFGDHKIVIKQKYDNGMVDIEFDLVNQVTVEDFLEIFGAMPIPPYIRGGKADGRDDDDYQTIFSNPSGSVAAPTAGLHFADSTFVDLKKKGIEFCFLTLHVGAGTYIPIKDSIETHHMHSEVGEISEEAANHINEAKKQGKKIIAVGTTVLRALEHVAQNHNIIKSGKFETDIFIKPGFDFKIVDRLVTNFHLPKSTLMLLVSAFAGHYNITNAYEHAIEQNYRFLSYGDAMMITRQE